MKDYTPRPIKCLEPVGDAIRDFMGGIVLLGGCLGMIAALWLIISLLIAVF